MAWSHEAMVDYSYMKESVRAVRKHIPKMMKLPQQPETTWSFAADSHKEAVASPTAIEFIDQHGFTHEITHQNARWLELGQPEPNPTQLAIVAAEAEEPMGSLAACEEGVSRLMKAQSNLSVGSDVSTTIEIKASLSDIRVDVTGTMTVKLTAKDTTSTFTITSSQVASLTQAEIRTYSDRL